jgi:hypothetical protein
MEHATDVGFDRPKTEPLRGTVKFYQRHVLVCTGHTEWPAHIETAGGFVQVLSDAIAARAHEMPVAVKLTACDEPSQGAATDLLIFPDMVRYAALREEDVPRLVAEHLVGNRACVDLAHGPITGQHVFVCVHANRDPRCGFCGPLLAEQLAAEILARGLDGKVAVHRTSHVGGHEYAGNVLIYPGGDWYGYVTPADIPLIVEEHLIGGKIVQRLWRGRMGLTREKQLAE